MNIHLKKYNGDTTTLPYKDHMPGATPFKEIDSPKKMQKFILTRGLILAFLLSTFSMFHTTNLGFSGELGIFCSLLTIFPRNLLRALCFKEDVFIYINMRKMSILVHGTEAMSKSRFIVMNILPDIVFGVIPFMIFVFFPHYIFLGMFGSICIAIGVGDYYNVKNAIKQMPRGAKTYFYQVHSYWYLPS